MKFSIILFIGAACFVENSVQWGMSKWPLETIRTTYSINPFSGYTKAPLNSNTDEMNDFEEVSDVDLGIPAKLYCRPQDPRVCHIFDLKGVNIGIQISFLDSDTKDVKGYDFTAFNGTYIRTNIYSEGANSLRFYYTNPEKLTSDGRAASTSTADGVFVYIRGQLVELPTRDTKEKKMGEFYRQGCFPQMGQHYFYGMTESNTDCSQQLPIFGLYHNGYLIGFGVSSYGKASQKANGHSWYETVPMLGVRLIMPDRPSCVGDLVEQNGLYSMHVYFVERPYLVTCLFQ